MIAYKEISVVIQGALTSHEYNGKKWIELSCRSIRRYLPGAEIIVSTWNGEDTAGVDCDILIMNNDPGPLKSCYEGAEGAGTVNNINRQIVSTAEGLKKATRHYVMKLRSDSYLLNADFLDYYTRYGDNAGHGGTGILTFEPRNPWGIFYGQFCLCDFWFFGTKKELTGLWDIPLYSPHGMSGRDLLGEEYIYQRYAEKYKGGFDKEITDDFFMYREIIRRHFIIIPAVKSGIRSFKYPSLNNFFIVNLKHYVLSHSDWRCLACGDRRGIIRARIMACLQRCSGTFFLVIKDRLYGKKKGNTI